MIRFLYNLFFPLGLLFFLPGYLVKMQRRGNYREKFGQRLGFYSDDVHARLSRRCVTWIHAVSVGEVAVALKLAARMKDLNPKFFCVLTTTTTTGFSAAAKDSQDWIEVMYNPLDFWLVMRRAFRIIRPTRIVLVEAEIWPNLVAEARARNIPIALVNARLSRRSERRFRKFRFFVAPVFRQLDLVCAPEPEDAPRWTALGVPSNRIHRTGNIKYDVEETRNNEEAPRKVLNALGIGAARPVLFGGSTHAGEETILAHVFLKLRAEFPALFLIIAPRHAERAHRVRLSLEQLSLQVAMRSAINSPRSDCLLIDTTGELRNWYSVATVAFVGKSLTAHGGQNPVEPVMAGKPVIFGPHMENFAALARGLVAQHGAIQVETEDSLQTEIAALLRDAQARKRLVSSATEVLAGHRGATAAAASLITGLKTAR